jgi:hypothetical protein
MRQATCRTSNNSDKWCAPQCWKMNINPISAENFEKIVIANWIISDQCSSRIELSCFLMVHPAFLHGTGNDKQLGTGVLMHKGIISAVKRVEFVSDDVHNTYRSIMRYFCSECVYSQPNWR